MVARRALAVLAQPSVRPIATTADAATTPRQREPWGASAAPVLPTTPSVAGARRWSVLEQPFRLRLHRRALVAAALDRADPVLLELVVERAGLDPEQARRLGLHP